MSRHKKKHKTARLGGTTPLGEEDLLSSSAGSRSVDVSGCVEDLAISLELARLRLEQVPNVVVSQWEALPRDEGWGLPLVLTLDEDGGTLIPQSSSWMLRLTREERDQRIRLVPLPRPDYPHVTATFPHQLYNGSPGAGSASGELCTMAEGASEQSRFFGESEPAGIVARALFHVHHAIEWLHRAAAGTLAQAGDPYELPDFRTGERMHMLRLVVSEAQEHLAAWGTAPVYGAALLRRSHRGALKTLQGEIQVAQWSDLNGGCFRAVAWNDDSARPDATARARWVRLSSAPVVKPWKAPATVGELECVLQTQGVSLQDVVKTRFQKQKPEILLVGWPLPEVIGGPPVRMHWQAALIPRYPLRGDDRVEWIAATENAHPEGLFGRSLAPLALRSSRVVLIGAGALGSHIASLLVRGGLMHLAIVDGDVFEAGNSTRHVLGRTYHGMSKSMALAHILQRVSPCAKVSGIPEPVPKVVELPPHETIAAELSCADLIIDATGSDAVLRWLSSVALPEDCRLVSASTSAYADRLFLFGDLGTAFSDEAFSSWHAPAQEEEITRLKGVVLPRGQGCWSPLMPATPQGVMQCAGEAVDQIVQWLNEPTKSLRYRTASSSP